MLGDLFAQDELEAGEVTQTWLPAFKKLSKPPAKRQATNFVGLENQGATCYLNSLIQSMYMTPELRQGMFSIDPVELGVDLVESFEQEKAEGSKKGLIEPDEASLSLLLSMGIAEHHAKRALIATKNASVDEVFTYIEAHEHDSEFNKPLEEVADNGARKKKKPRQIPLEIQRLFTQLQLIDQNAVTTEELTTKGFQWQNMDGQVQHDAHELNRLLIDALEKSLKRTSGETLCRRLYEGSCANQIKCMSCQGVSERSEVFYDINLQVIDCPDLCASLRRHCAGEVLAGDSAYQCDTCRGRREALRTTVLRTLPQVLTFSCSRFRIDRSTNWTRVKVTSRSEFPVVFDMQPYTEGAAGSVKEPIHPNPDVEADVVTALRQGPNVSWLHDIQRRAEKVAGELIEQFGDGAQLRDVDEAQYEAIARHLVPHYFSADTARKMMYELHAVIMHRGSAHSGHYFAYIRDSLSEGHWVHPKAEDFEAALNGVGQEQDGDAGAPSDSAATQAPVSKGAQNAWTTGAASASAAAVKAPAASKGKASALRPSAATFTPGAGAASHGAGASAGGAGTGTVHSPLKQYVLRPDGKGVSVDQTSPLGIILRVMLNSVPAPRRTNDPHQKTSQARAPSTPIVFKTNIIATEVGHILKNSWANVHKAKLGSLEQFMRAQSDVLRVAGNGEVALINTNVYLVSPSDYQRLLPKGPSAAGGVKGGSGTGKPSTETPEQSDQSRLDEALARSLQMECDIERHDQAERDRLAGKLSSSSAVQNSWETAGTKKKATISHSNQQDKASSAAEKKAHKTVNTAAPLDPAHARKQLLAAEIISHFYGNYYEFNDSSITPIEFGHLAQAFEGPDSAYLLVYRRLEVSNDAAGFLRHSRARLVPREQMIQDAPSRVKNAGISPPLHWAQVVAAQNEALAQERIKYELSFSNITVAVHFPAQLRYEEPLLYPASAGTDAGITEDSTREDSCEAARKPFVLIEIDSRKSIADFQQAVLEQYLAQLTALGIAVTTPSSKLAVSVLEAFGEGYYPVNQVGDDAVVGEVCGAVGQGQRRASAAAHLLLWDGKTLHGQAVLAGLAGYPKQLSVSLLVPGSSVLDEASVKRTAAESRASKVPAVTETKLFPSLYLSSGLSLLEFAHKVCDLSHIDRLQACISVLCVSAERKGERTFVSTPLYKQGILSNKALIGSSPLNSISNGGASGGVHTADSLGEMMLTSNSALGEFPELYYVLVEDAENRGLQGSNLADALVTRKNAEWTVTVELDFTPGEAAHPDGAEGTAAAKSVRFEGCPSTVQFDIPRYDSVAELKYTALKLLQLSAQDFGETTRLRVGANRGETVLSDESVDLVAAALRNGSTLYLEQGARPASDILLLNVVLVTGNSLELKYAPQDGGVRGQEVEVAVALTDTVEALRDQAGVLLLGYAPGWTQRCAALALGSGVRNHLGEEITITVDGAPVSVPGGVSAAAPVGDAPTVDATENTPESDLALHKAAAREEFGADFCGRRLRNTTWMKEALGLIETTAEAPVSAPARTASSSDVKPGAKAKGKASELPTKAASVAESAVLTVRQVTVKESGLKSGDTVLFEEGNLPIKGQMNLQIFVWRPAGKVDSADATGDSQPQSIIEEASMLRRACLVPLGSVDANEKDAVEALQSTVHGLMIHQREYVETQGLSLSGVEQGADRILLRELRADMLPGRCYWTSEVVAPPAEVKPPAPGAGKAVTGDKGKSAPVGSAEKKEPPAGVPLPPAPTSAAQAAAGPVNTLRKFGIRPERGLVVELLSDSQGKVRPPVGAFRVWVQQLLNPGAPLGQAAVSPQWPPMPVLVNGGAAPTLGHLKRAISTVLPDIPSEHVSVYKYQSQALEWQGMVSAGVGLHTRKKGSIGSKKGAESNIAQAPYFIKEGDQLVVFDNRLTKLSPGNSADPDGFIQIALPEDVQLRRLRDDERAARKLKKQYKTSFDLPEGSAGGGTVTKVRNEVMLSLGSGFDFSDDES